MGESADRFRYHLAAGTAAAGLALAPASEAAAGGVAGAAALVLLALRRGTLAVLCGGLVCAGAAAGELRLRSIDAPGERVAAFARIDERAILLERPRTARTRSRAELRLVSGSARGAKLLAVAAGTWRGPAEPGTEVRVRGVAKPPRRADDGGFDWPAHLRRRAIAHELHLSAIAPTGRRRGGPAGAVDAARRRAEAAIESGLAPDRAALMRGMVLGQDSEIDPLTVDDWRDSGLAHLLAVSGQNVMLLCALAYPLLALAGARPGTRVAVMLGLIAVYVPLAGAGPSIQRAGVMGAAGLVALAASRPASGSYALLLAAVATLALNPRVAGDAGWQLSFAAVTGILATRFLAPRGPAAAALWLTVAAAVATAPLLALHFGALPLVTVPANLLALPAVAPVMWAGMLQAAIGQAAAAGGPAAEAARALAAALGTAAAPLLAWLGHVATTAGALPNAVAEVRAGGPAGVGAAYALLAGILVAARRAGARLSPRVGGLRARLRASATGRIAAVALAAAAAFVALGLDRALTSDPPRAVRVSFLDVGQGDATLVQDPSGAAVLFDGGRAEARVARLLAQAGVRRLSVVVATHASADHHGGLAEVIDRFPVDLLLDGGDGTRDPSFRALLGRARDRGVRVAAVRQGQQWRAGALAIRILWPPPRPPGPAPEDPNPRATVALVSSGRFDLLLSADAESPTLAQLSLPDVEAMKVPHHGSGDPGLGGVLRALRPEVAVIPVGENSYGHPHPQTVETLRRLVPHVRRTDHDGTVRLEAAGGALRLQP